MVKTLTAAILLLTVVAGAVEFRVASFNVGALYVSGGPVYGLGDPGTPGYEATKAVLGRINADVVALQEIHNADIDEEPSGTPEDIEVLASDLGYPYIYNPPRTSLDFTFRVIFLSRYPFLTSTSIGPPAVQGVQDPSKVALDVTRRFSAVKVNIPGTNQDPLIISGHLKSDTDLVSRFRRTIEMKRLSDYLSANTTAADNFIILGDFNFSASINSDTTFATIPDGLPSSYNLGSDVTLPVTYFHNNPVAYFSNPIPVRPPLRQVNGSTGTFGTSPGANQSAIDLLLISPAINSRPYAAEIYNSVLDTSNSVGLPKAGAPLASTTSNTASDHFAIFADVELDLGFPQLTVSFNQPSVSEKSASGTAKLTVTIPAAKASALSLSLSSSAPGIAFPVNLSPVIPAGATSVTVDLSTIPNFIADDGNNVTFTASAFNHESGSGALLVTDAEGPYTFTSVNQTIVENFNSFTGNRDPSPWDIPGQTPWLGIDNGSSPTPGLRSYGSPSNPSLGVLPDSSSIASTFFTATYRNQSQIPLTSLGISLTVRQWRAALGGTADRLTASILTSTGALPVPSLTFAPATNLATGAITNPADILLTATVSGFSIPPGQSFDLQFKNTPGPGGGQLSSDVFINEFHYNNVNPDTDEFVEVVVGPGYSGPLSDLRLYLYNGANGTVYNTTTAYTLDTFMHGGNTASGHKIYYRMILDLQNGNPDGFAIVKGSQVVQFISYGGTFIATNGPAIGLTTVNTGFTQPDNTPANTNSIRLTGTGGSASDFTWAKTAIAHTPGSMNVGQTFTSPPQAQGISLDDISVTFLPDPVDTDGDGFADSVETNLLLTNPADPNSKFAAVASNPSPAVSRIRFPTLTGRKYLIQTSPDLVVWTDGPEYSGNGSPRTVDFAIDPQNPRFFFKVRVVFE